MNDKGNDINIKHLILIRYVIFLAIKKSQNSTSLFYCCYKTYWVIHSSYMNLFVMKLSYSPSDFVSFSLVTLNNKIFDNRGVCASRITCDAGANSSGITPVIRLAHTPHRSYC